MIRLKLDSSRIDSAFGTHQNPPQKAEFFYFTGLVAKQVAREGFSGEMRVCLILNQPLKRLLKEIPISLTTYIAWNLFDI